jgi:uncharacterized protein
VWTYLIQPSCVVTCLPGAALESSSEDGLRHDGNVTVKLGALSVSYRGTAEFTEVDQGARRLGVRAKGREKTGAGSADMTMVATVHATGAGTSEVELEAAVTVTGKIVTLGRGMIQVVTEQVLDEFTACLASTLAADAARATGGTGEGAAAAGANVSADARPAAPPPAPANGLAILWRALRSWLRRLLGGS